MPSARAWIGRRHQGHPAGERAAQSGSADPENALLQRLTQLIEDGSRKFSELIKKQHASMGQAQFAWTGIDPPPREALLPWCCDAVLGMVVAAPGLSRCRACQQWIEDG